MIKSNMKTFFLLHIMIMIYSLSGMICKRAATEKFLSGKFIVYYAVVLLLLGFYAIGWQQIIKKLDLTTAYANRAITIVWGIVWGVVFFQERITVGKIIGAVLVISGVVLFAYADGEGKQNG